MEWDDIPATGSESAPQELIERTATELEEFLDDHSDARAEVLEILGRRIEPHPGPDTWPAIRTSLGEYLGAGAASLVLWTSVVDSDVEDRTRRVQRLEETGQIGSASLVRSVRAAYGVELQRAWELLGEIPDNWRWINRSVFVDVLRERPLVRLTITKFNGEELILELPGDSLLSLVEYLVITLASIGDRTAFNESLVDDFLTETNILIEALQAPSPSET